MTVRRHAAAQDHKRRRDGCLHAVGDTRGDPYGIAGLDRKPLHATLHGPRATHHVIDLFAAKMAVKSCCGTGIDRRLGKTYSPVTVMIGVP